MEPGRVDEEDDAGDHDLGEPADDEEHRCEHDPPEAEIGQTHRVPDVEHVPGEPEEERPQQGHRDERGDRHGDSAGDERADPENAQQHAEDRIHTESLDHGALPYAAPVSLLAVVAAVAALAAPGPGPLVVRSFPHFPRGCARADFTSEGARVRAEFCRASGNSGAAVVVLHGCGGFSTFDHRLVTKLPSYGIATFEVDYFALTPPPNRRGFCRGGGNSVEALPTWIGVVADAGKTLRKQRGVRSVGIVGWSLGGDVALAAASASHHRRPFRAVAGFSTDPVTKRRARWLPPTILLFGGHSDRALVREALRQRRRLRSRVLLEVYDYPGGTHQWPGRQGDAGIAEAAAFLRRHLH